MVPRWLFRLVQSLMLVAKVLYWQLYVLFLSGAFMLGIKEVAPRLNKVPPRVALCVEVGAEPSHQEVLDLVGKCALAVTWCFDAGVDDVTIFESGGLLAEARELFCRRVQQRLRSPPRFPCLVFGKLGRINAVQVFEAGNDKPSSVVECASAEEATETVSVRFLSGDDSDRDLARVAQELVDDKEVAPERITEGLLNGRLSSSRGNTSKLNLILTYSVSPNLLGFPPWLMRTPEILNIGESIVRASYASFVWAMFKFSKTEQRWGR